MGIITTQEQNCTMFLFKLTIASSKSKVQDPSPLTFQAKKKEYVHQFQ
jgi:hypothetical protein